jgi:RNA polymerase sigma-70 factor, ECF subfamily
MSPASQRHIDSPIDPSLGSFEAFYRAEYQSVLALAMVLTSSRAQAEDLTQESFLAAYTAWSGISNPATWIRGTVSNKAMTWWRRVYAARRATIRAASHESAIDAMPADTDDFWAEVRRLPRRQAQVVTLYYLEEWTTKEIAIVLGCEESTVRIHLSRGRRALATRLKVVE